MATYNISIAPQVSTDAEFRAVGLFISTVFALSFSQVYSNINWASVTRTGVGTYAGKEIWSSNDAGGGLNNFYVLVEYGQGSGSASYMQIRVTIGWAHDGAGNLTGITTTPTAIGQTGVSPTPNIQYGSADAGRLRFVYGVSGASFILGIERLKENGVYVNKVNIHSAYGSGISFNQTSKSGYAFTAVSSFTLGSAFTTSNNIQEGYVGLGFHYPFANGWGNKLRNFMAVPAGQLGANYGSVTMNIGGTNFTYLIIPSGLAMNLLLSNSYNALMLYQ